MIFLIFSWFSDCSYLELILDGFCHDETNNENCNYDGGDCCGYNITTDYCSDCKCYDNEACFAGTHPFVGDGFCNDDTNIADCNYDGGDCCRYDVNTDFCSDCKCYVNETCVAGTHPLVGDGFCHDETNNANCNYDDGDCCGDCVLNNQCTHCACLGGADTMNVLIGNFVCNEEANIADCYYDGGDCCKSFEVLDLMQFMVLFFFQLPLSYFNLTQFVKQNMMIKKQHCGHLIFILIILFEDCLIISNYYYT